MRSSRCFYLLAGTHRARSFLLHARDTLGSEAEALLEGTYDERSWCGCRALTDSLSGLLEHGRLQLSQLLQRAAVRPVLVSRTMLAH